MINPQKRREILKNEGIFGFFTLKICKKLKNSILLHHVSCDVFGA